MQTQAEITKRVRAELERSEIDYEVVNNNTVEARGCFVTTVILVERNMRGGEHGHVKVFVDGYPRCGFGFEPVDLDEAGDMSRSDGLGG